MLFKKQLTGHLEFIDGWAYKNAKLESRRILKDFRRQAFYKIEII